MRKSLLVVLSLILSTPVLAAPVTFTDCVQAILDTAKARFGEEVGFYSIGSHHIALDGTLSSQYPVSATGAIIQDLPGSKFRVTDVLLTCHKGLNEVSIQQGRTEDTNGGAWLATPMIDVNYKPAKDVSTIVKMMNEKGRSLTEIEGLRLTFYSSDATFPKWIVFYTRNRSLFNWSTYKEVAYINDRYNPMSYEIAFRKAE